jgi:hypothetical protein
MLFVHPTSWNGKHKETTRGQWQSSAEPWYRWTSLAEDVAPGRVWHAGRLRRPRVGRGILGGWWRRKQTKLTGRFLKRAAVTPTAA